MMKEKVAVGADFGGTRMKLGLVAVDSGRILESQILSSPKEGSEALLSCFYDAITQMCSNQSLSVKELLGVGVSIGSYVFLEGGVIDTMCQFLGFPDLYPLGQTIENALQIPCRVENDAKLIGLAESRYGAGRSFERVLMLTLGTGVGVSLTVSNRSVPDDARLHLAGHIKVRDYGAESILDGEVCYCGIQGCMESTCSGTALQCLSRSILGDQITNESLFKLALEGDCLAAPLVERYLTYLAVGLNQYAYLYAPDVIILGGGVSNGLEPWMDELERKVTARIHSRYQLKIHLGALRESSGILGAAGLFADRLGGV